MEKSENEPPPAEGSDGVPYNHWVWLHLSSQLIFYVLNQHANFPTFLTALYDAVSFFRKFLIHK